MHQSNCYSNDSDRPHRTCWPLTLKISTADRPKYAPSKNAPCCGGWDSGPHIIYVHCSTGRPEPALQTASWWVQPLLHGSGSRPTHTDTTTNRPRYIVNNRPHLALVSLVPSAAMRPNNPRYTQNTHHLIYMIDCSSPVFYIGYYNSTT